LIFRDTRDRGCARSGEEEEVGGLLYWSNSIQVWERARTLMQDGKISESNKTVSTTMRVCLDPSVQVNEFFLGVSESEKGELSGEAKRTMVPT